MKREYYNIVFITAACLLTSLYYHPFNVLFTDTEVFRYMGLAISKGLVPYRDFFDHKPPLIYFLNYAGLLLGGAWGAWAINTSLALLATWSFYRRCRQYHLPYPWLLPVLFNLMLRDGIISRSLNGTREFTTLFFLLFFCILMGKSRYKDLWLGLLTGLVFFTQQEQVLSLIPFLIYSLSNRIAVPALIRVLFMAAGFSTVLLPLLLYLGANSALSYFWQDAFLFNFSWYTTEKKTFLQHFSTVRQVLSVGNYEIPLSIAVILGILSLLFKHERKGLVVAAMTAAVLTLAPEFMGGRYQGSGEPTDFPYYFLPMAAAISILLFVSWAFTEDNLLTNRKQRLFFAILLCSNLVFTLVQHATHMTPWDKISIVASPEASYLRQHRPGDYQFYVIMDNDYIYIYNELGILAPSRWIYHHFWWWYERWDADQAILHSIGADLLRHKTTYILFDPERLGRFRDPASANWMMSFLNAHYERVALPGKPSSILWKLKPTP